MAIFNIYLILMSILLAFCLPFLSVKNTLFTWANTKPAIFFLVLSLVFYLDKVILGPFSTIRIHDTFDSEFSKYKNYGDLFFQFGFFHWFPGAQGGMPSLASQFGPQYILSLLSHFVPLWLLYSIEVVFLMYAAGFGTYQLSKIFFKIEHQYALAIGILFSLVSQIQANNIPVTVFNYVFPLFLAVFILYTDPKTSLSKKFLYFAIIAFLFSWSYPALTLPMFGFLQISLILIFKNKCKNRFNIIKWTIIIWLGYVLFSAPSLFSLLSYIPSAHRSYAPLQENVAYFSLIGSLLKTLEYTFFYYLLKCGLLIPFIICLFFILKNSKLKSTFLLFFFCLLISSFFYSPLHRLLAGTIFSKFDMGHFIWTLPFLATTQVALTYQLIKDNIVKFKWLNYYLIFSIIFSACIIILSPQFDQNRIVLIPNLLLSSALGLIFTQSCRSKIKGMNLTIILITGLFLQFKYIRIKGEESESVPYAKYLNNHSQIQLLISSNHTPFRVGSLDNAPYIFSYYGLETVDGRGPLFNKAFKDIIREIVRPQLDNDNLNRFNNYWYDLYLNNHGAALNYDMLGLINTKYLFSQYLLKNPPNKIELVEQIQSDAQKYPEIVAKKYSMPLYIYQIKSRLERAYLVSHVSLLPGPDQILKSLSKLDFKSLSTQAFIDKVEYPMVDFVKLTNSTELTKNDVVHFESYTPDKITLRVSTGAARLLVISNNFDKNWQVTINSIPGTLIKVNHAFQSVYLESAGDYKVELIYFNNKIQLYFVLSFLGLGLVFLPLIIKWF